MRSIGTEVEQAIKMTHPITIDRNRIEAVNHSSPCRSRIGHALAERALHGVPCGLVYRVSGQGVDVSLYSIGDFDVAELAKKFGGGGHRNAAGFNVSLQEWMDRFA